MYEIFPFVLAKIAHGFLFLKQLQIPRVHRSLPSPRHLPKVSLYYLFSDLPQSKFCCQVLFRIRLSTDPKISMPSLSIPAMMTCR